MRERVSSTIVLEWQADGSCLVTDGRDGRRIDLGDRALAALLDLGRPSGDDAAGAGDLAELREKGVLTAAPPVCGAGLWTGGELAVQARAADGRPRSSGARALPDIPAPPVEAGQRIELPAPEPSPLGELLDRRASSRELTRPLDAASLGAFLSRSFSRNAGGRPSPTSGGVDELRAVVLVRRVRGVRPGAYWHDPDRGELAPIAPARHSAALVRHNLGRARWYLGVGPRQAPSVLLLIMAAWDRLLARYENVTLLSGYWDAGALMQTMYLAAADLALPACALACVSPLANARWLGVEPFRMSQVGAFALGGR
jgi:SagB-type dehydrogenase family enzyme